MKVKSFHRELFDKEAGAQSLKLEAEDRAKTTHVLGCHEILGIVPTLQITWKHFLDHSLEKDRLEFHPQCYTLCLGGKKWSLCRLTC